MIFRKRFLSILLLPLLVSLFWGCAERGGGDASQNKVTSKPGKPGSLFAVYGNGQNSVAWAPADTSADSFILYWSNQPGITRETANKISVKRLGFLHTGLKNELRYYYAVSGVNNNL